MREQIFLFLYSFKSHHSLSNPIFPYCSPGQICSRSVKLEFISLQSRQKYMYTGSVSIMVLCYIHEIFLLYLKLLEFSWFSHLSPLLLDKQRDVTSNYTKTASSQIPFYWTHSFVFQSVGTTHSGHMNTSLLKV